MRCSDTTWEVSISDMADDFCLFLQHQYFNLKVSIQFVPLITLGGICAWFKGSFISFLWISKDKNKLQYFYKSNKNCFHLYFWESAFLWLVIWYFTQYLNVLKTKGEVTGNAQLSKKSRSHWIIDYGWMHGLLQLARRELIWHKGIFSSAEMVCPTYRDATAA